MRGIFVVTNGADGGLLIVPDTVNITGPDTETCSSGVVTSFFIFGGTPPYTISNTFPQLLTISPTVVDSSGAGFNATTRGACLTPAIVGITDAAGHTKTVEITNDLGDAAPPTTTSSNPITVTPSTIPDPYLRRAHDQLVGGGGTISTTGGTQTVTPAKAWPSLCSRADVVLDGRFRHRAADLDRPRVGSAPGPNPTPASVSLFISDGSQTKTVNIPIATTRNTLSVVVRATASCERAPAGALCSS